KAKLKSNPVKVRFAEEVVINGQMPETVKDNSLLFMPNVLKVYLENGQTKSFKFDNNTSIKHRAEGSASKLMLLHEQEMLAQVTQRPGAHTMKCFFRISFVPKDPVELLRRDPVAFEYLYVQSCNDVVLERFGSELKYDTALRLAALQMYILTVNTKQSQKVSLKYIEKEWGLALFLPPAVLSSMKEKNIKKALTHVLKTNQNLVPPGKKLTALQAKVHYLKYLSDLRLYGGRVFKSVLQGEKHTEVTLLVGPRYGISHVINTKTNLVALLADFSHVNRIEMYAEDQRTVRVELHVLDVKPITLLMESVDAMNLACLTAGYYRLLVDSRRSIFNVSTSSTESADTGHDARAKQNYRAIEWTYSTPYPGGGEGRGGSEGRGGGEGRGGTEGRGCGEGRCCGNSGGGGGGGCQRCGPDFSSHRECDYRSDHGRCDGDMEPVYISEIHQAQHAVHMAHRVERCRTPLPQPYHTGTGPRPKPQDSARSAKVSFIFGDPPLDSVNPQNLGYRRLTDERSADTADDLGPAYRRLEDDYRLMEALEDAEGYRYAPNVFGPGGGLEEPLLHSVPTRARKGPEDEPLDEAVVSTLQALEALAASEDQSPVESSSGVEMSRAFSPESSSDSGNETNSSEMTESSELASAQRHSENHLRMVHLATAEGYRTASEEKTEFITPARGRAEDMDYSSRVPREEQEEEAKSSAVSSSSRILHSDGGEMEPETMETKSLTDYFSQMHMGSVMGRRSAEPRDAEGGAAGELLCLSSDTCPHLVGKYNAFTAGDSHYMNQLDLGRTHLRQERHPPWQRGPGTKMAEHLLTAGDSQSSRAEGPVATGDARTGTLDGHRHRALSDAPRAGAGNDGGPQSDAACLFDYRLTSLQGSEGGVRSLQGSQCSSIDAGCGTGSAGEQAYGGGAAGPGKAGHPVDPTLQRKTHGAIGPEPGYGTLREGSSHRGPKIKETTACTQLKKAQEEDPSLAVCNETNAAANTTTTTTSTPMSPPPLESSTDISGHLQGLHSSSSVSPREPSTDSLGKAWRVGMLRRSWSTVTPPGVRSFDALLEKTRNTLAGKSGGPSGPPPGPPKQQPQRRFYTKTLPKSWSQRSVESVNSSGRKLLRGASVLLPASAVPKLKTGAWRCHAPFSQCFLSHHVNHDGDHEGGTVKFPFPPLAGSQQPRQFTKTTGGEEHAASLKADQRGDGPTAAPPSTDQDMSLKARLARVSAMMGKTYSLPSGFEGARKDALEMIGLVRRSLDQGPGCGCPEVGEEGGGPADLCQALLVQAKALSAACGQMAREHSSPEELLLTLTQSFHTLCCLTQACMSLAQGLRAEPQRRRQAVATVDEVVAGYVRLLDAAEAASGSDRGGQSVSALMRHSAAISAAVDTLTRSLSTLARRETAAPLCSEF
ncbi:hypothetical protein NHX12_006687, partial [Muraenolepis orangiensis]